MDRGHGTEHKTHASLRLRRGIPQYIVPYIIGMESGDTSHSRISFVIATDSFRLEGNWIASHQHQLFSIVLIAA